MLQHIHVEFISTSLLLILTGFNTTVYIDFSWPLTRAVSSQKHVLWDRLDPGSLALETLEKSEL